MLLENFRIFIFTLFALTLLMLAGCAGRGGGIVSAPEPPEPVFTGLAGTSGLDVEFEAMANKNSVYIRVKNNTPVPFRVNPYCFALIINNQHPEIRFNPAQATSEFPTARLASGTEATGFITFKDYKDLVGQKLVFNSPDYKPMLTIIKSYIKKAK